MIAGHMLGSEGSDSIRRTSCVPGFRPRPALRCWGVFLLGVYRNPVARQRTIPSSS